MVFGLPDQANISFNPRARGGRDAPDAETIVD